MIAGRGDGKGGEGWGGWEDSEEGLFRGAARLTGFDLLTSLSPKP